MKTHILSLSMLALAAMASTPARAQLAFIQLSPVTSASTIVCSNFVKNADGTWMSVAQTPFSLGIIHGIVPPVRAIRSGSYIYNSVDLFTQLNYQCGASAVVTAKY